MALPSGSPGTPTDPSTRGTSDADWPRQATEQVVKVVDTVREKTTGPVLTAARGLVFGLLAAFAAFLFVVVLLIALVRGITELTDRVWLTYVILGVPFTLGGLLMWRKRKPRGNL